MLKPFKISAGLKNLLGRELITSDSVAIFELVKNSLDAHAKTVRILFEEDRIVVTDDGKGMSQTDILDKWLFVGYSAKSEGTEDENYHLGGSRRARAFAGSKGVGPVLVRPAREAFAAQVACAAAACADLGYKLGTL